MDGDDLRKAIMAGQNPFAALGTSAGTTATDATALMTQMAILDNNRLLTRPHMQRGFGDEDVLEMQMMLQGLSGQGLQINPNNGWMMYGDDLYEDGLFNLLNL